MYFRLLKIDKKLVEKKQTYLWRKLKSKQTLMNG